MPLPALTRTQRAEALEKAAAVRRERGELLAQLKRGDLPLHALLDREDDVVGKIRVRRLLESLPGIVRAGQLISDLGISERRRVRGLGNSRRLALLTRFPAAE